MSLTLAASVGLRGSGVTVAYGPRAVVHAVDVHLVPGAVTALVGPNGSGKSTLLRGLARLQRIRSGSVHIGEQDSCTLSGQELAQRLTMLTQGRPTPHGLTVDEVVRFGRHPHQRGWLRRADPEGAAAVVRALQLTGLDDLADRDVGTLSGGQTQRVWLAACLAQDTDVLLLDEPTTYLDLRHQVEILDLIRGLADDHGVTIGVVLHDLNHAAAVADQVAVLAHGRVVAYGPPSTAFTAELLSNVFEIPLHIGRDPRTGVVSVAPLPRPFRSLRQHDRRWRPTVMNDCAIPELVEGSPTPCDLPALRRAQEPASSTTLPRPAVTSSVLTPSDS